MKGIGYTLLVCAALYFCLFGFLRKRIMLAVHVVKEAAKCMQHVNAMALLPVIQSIGLLLFLIPWVIYATYLASSGAITTETIDGLTYKKYSYNKDIRYAFLFLLFCWFWTSQVVRAMCPTASHRLCSS
jgi:hypothetical protein